MSSGSFFEQFTGNWAPSMVTIVSSAILGVLLVYTLASRFLFSSPSKPKSTASKQQSNKDTKKNKEANGKKSQADTASANKKKAPNAQGKKSAPVAPPSASSQSEESEDETVAPVVAAKKPTTPNKGAAGKRVSAEVETSKTNISANAVKAPAAKQQTVGQVEKSDATKAGENKKKQTPTNATAAANKRPTSGKGDATDKVNANASNKKQGVVVEADANRAPVASNESEPMNEQDGDDQWVMQGGKQVTSRNRNKGKVETSNSNKPGSPSAPSTRKNVADKVAASGASASHTASSTKKTESEFEAPVRSNTSVPMTMLQEPIEVCQLLPTRESPYTASDDWWKQALNKQQTFSIDDIGEWPEREQDEQYVIQIERIVPTKSAASSKMALGEKDINVETGAHDAVGHYQNETAQHRSGKLNQQDEISNSNEEKSSSSMNIGESTASVSQPKKKVANVRRIT